MMRTAFASSLAHRALIPLMKKETILTVIVALLFLYLMHRMFKQENKHPEHDPDWTNAPLVHP
jgi:hypothetical protein